MKKLTVFGLVAMLAGTTLAGWGFWDADRSWVIINDGGGNDGYSLWNSAPGTFQGADFGDFNPASDTLTLVGYDTKAWKDGSSDVNAVEYFYMLYETGNRPGVETWNSLGGGWISDTPFQLWGNQSANVNLLNGLSTGKDYTLEIYGRLQGTDDGNPANNYFQYDSNGGSNYTATFATIPEPATFGLLAIGAGLMYLRKRRA